MKNKKAIYINIPVRNLKESTVFYEKLGFVKNETFSNDTTANALMWSDEIVLMILEHDFFKKFIEKKEIPDAKKTAQVLFCLTFDSRQEVDDFAIKAENAGGRKYKIITPGTEEFMYGYEVEDLDGNIWEPLYMDISKFK